MGTVRIRVPALLKERDLSVQDLMYGARLAPGTAYKLADQRTCDLMTGISFDVLVRVCRFLNVTIEDVLELTDPDSSVGAP